MFMIKDTGIGMDEQEKAKLFRPFSQASPTIKEVYGGSGLGLKISKQLVELMGGKIEIHSQKGVGSTFEFTVKGRLPTEQERGEYFESQNFVNQESDAKAEERCILGNKF